MTIETIETLLAQQKHCQNGSKNSDDYCNRPCRRCQRCQLWRQQRKPNGKETS
jgi:hypothetical protein